MRPNRKWTKPKHESTHIVGLQVSNENACLPNEGDIRFQADFCNDSERKHILQDIEKEEFKREGYDRRIRVQRYTFSGSKDKCLSLSSPACPESLLRLASRVQEFVSDGQDRRLPLTHIIVEEHTLTPWSYSGDYAPNHIVASFETPNQLVSGEEENDDGNYYVARIVLNNAIVHHINKPAERQQLLWTLTTAKHHTNLLLQPGSLLIQQGEFLQNWRSYTTAAVPEDSFTSANKEENDAPRSTIVKFVRLPDTSLQDQENKADVDFGFMATPQDRIPRSGEMPSLRDLLTIIVTTSPIKSHPSTEMLERTFDTFEFAGEDFLNCRKVIVCDGFRQHDTGEKVSKKHTNAKQAMRNGIVNQEQADNYIAFKERLRKLCRDAKDNSPFRSTVVEELDERMGYGFALRHALRHCVSTPFVCVIQHDRSFMRPTPMKDVVHAMWCHRTIKYVGVSMRSNLRYRDIFLAKYGKSSEDEIKSMVLRPPELLLDASVYGPNGSSKDVVAKLVSDKVFKSVQACSDAYQTSLQCTDQLKWVEENPPPEGKHQLSLTPTLFWYDNTHVCETAHYRDFVFNPKYKMVARGGFVEDKLSPVIKRTTERLGLTEGHARFGCFLLDDHSGYYFTGHLDGGNYVTEKEKPAMSTNNS